MKPTIPVDLKQCQTERPSTWPQLPSFMTLGPVTYTRCTKKPTWIADNGLGTMSLCDECKQVCADVFRKGEVIFYRITKVKG